MLLEVIVVLSLVMSNNTSGLDYPPKHIILNGTSCAGKTSIAQSVIASWKSKHIEYRHFSIDSLYQELLASLTDEQTKDLPQLIKQAEEKNVTHPVMAFEMWPRHMNNLFKMWFDAYFDAVATMPATIMELVCDHKGIMNTFLSAWTNYNKPAIHFVKVYCTQDAAQRRLLMRNQSKNTNEHRHTNTVEANFNRYTTIHAGILYDLEIDTTHITPADAAQYLLNYQIKPHAVFWAHNTPKIEKNMEQ